MATFSYSGDPSVSLVDEVRFWVQDTNPDSNDFWMLSDEEISYLIDQWLDSSGSVIFVSAVAAEVIAAKFTNEVSVSADGVSVSVSDLQNRYLRLAVQLREQYKNSLSYGAGPFLTGIDGMWSMVRDASIQPLIFGVGFMDNAEAGRQDYGDRHPGSYYDFGAYDAGSE